MIYSTIFRKESPKNQEGNILTSKPDLTPTSMRRWTYWESDGDTPLPASPAGQTILHNCSSFPFSCPFCSAFSSVSYTAETIAPARRSRVPQQRLGSLLQYLGTFGSFLFPLEQKKKPSTQAQCPVKGSSFLSAQIEILGGGAEGSSCSMWLCFHQFKYWRRHGSVFYSMATDSLSTGLVESTQM